MPHVLFISGTYFSPHLALLYIFLALPIAYGISKVISMNKIFLFVVVFLYLISFINFVNIYFTQFPKQGHFDFGSRELSNYIKLSSRENKVDVFVKSPQDIYNKYIYYSNSLNKDNYKEIQKSISSKKYSLGNIKFFNCGDIKEDFNSKNVTIYESTICGDYQSEVPKIKLPQLTDGGEIYRIYGDKICSGYKLNPYPQEIQLKDFSVEKLSARKFCEVFITR
jgi:hypothetical protein